MDRKTWQATVLGVAKSHILATEQQHIKQLAQCLVYNINITIVII